MLPNTAVSVGILSTRTLTKQRKNTNLLLREINQYSRDVVHLSKTHLPITAKRNLVTPLLFFWT